MPVFLSYSTRDAVMARLILHIFEKSGVDCFLAERDIPIGAHFDSEIAEKIRQSRALLVLWSSDAASSPWVNQEVGIALGQNIPVWPIAIEEIDIEGAIFRTQGVYLTRHSDPHEQIAALARQIRESPARKYRNLSPTIDQYIVGAEERTKRIVQLLRQEGRKVTPEYTLRAQAAFSSFAISPDPGYRLPGYHTPDHHRLLIQEFNGMKRMLRKGSLKGILWPRRGYDERFQQKRLANLIRFLSANSDYDRVRFVVGPWEGGNVMIFDSNVLVEGIKIREDTPGFDLTTISHHMPTIQSAINSFDTSFDDLWNDHAEACRADPVRGARKIRQYVTEELQSLAGAPPPAKDER